MVARDKFEYGATQGRISAEVEIARKVHDVLGDDFQPSESAEPFYGVKDISVFVVVRNDVKTLRLYKGNP